MADFNSFRELGEAFQRAAFASSGKKRQLDGFSGFAAGSKAGAPLQTALHAAGAEMREHFRNKIINGGPGWAPLNEDWTQAERAKNGFSADDPLFASGQMYEAIEYQVEGLNVKVGITDGDHTYPGDPTRTVKMETLFEVHETGYYNNLTGKWVTARPIFTDNDFGPKAAEVAKAFGETAIVNGWLKNLAPRGK